MRRALAIFMFALLSLSARAEQPTDLQPVPEPPPMPKEGVSQEVDAPQITIRTEGEDRVEEYRVRGKLYKIKVTPAHGHPYYLVDNKGDGNFSRQELDDGLRVPMWVITSW